MLFRLGYLTVSNVFTALRLLPMGDRDKAVEILALRHQIAVLERQLGQQRVHFTAVDRALLATLLHLWVPTTSSTSCDLGVFVDDAAEAVASPDLELVQIRRLGESPEWAGLLKRPMRSVPIVMIFILGQDASQMRQIPSEGSVEDLAATGADPSFHDRVRARCSHWGLDDPYAQAVKHRVECCHEFGVAVADE